VMVGGNYGCRGDDENPEVGCGNVVSSCKLYFALKTSVITIN
jgi:hypothetical protein